VHFRFWDAWACWTSPCSHAGRFGLSEVWTRVQLLCSVIYAFVFAW
jgi:hypothetical protein